MRKVWSGDTCSLPEACLGYTNGSPTLTLISLPSNLMYRYGLHLEYWHTKILLTIDPGVGIPLQIDQAIQEKKFGYYTRILIEVDLLYSLHDDFTIELLYYGFSVEIHYENPPSKCSDGHRFGHKAQNCHYLNNKDKKTKAQEFQGNKTRQIYHLLVKNSHASLTHEERKLV